MRALAFSLLLAAAPVFAEDLVATQGDDSVRLTEWPCSNEAVVAQLEPEAVKDWRAASAVFQGQRFQACWRMMGNAAYLVYEDGDRGTVPASHLRPPNDI